MRQVLRFTSSVPGSQLQLVDLQPAVARGRAFVFGCAISLAGS